MTGNRSRRTACDVRGTEPASNRQNRYPRFRDLAHASGEDLSDRGGRVGVDHQDTQAVEPSVLTETFALTMIGRRGPAARAQLTSWPVFSMDTRSRGHDAGGYRCCQGRIEERDGRLRNGSVHQGGY